MPIARGQLVVLARWPAPGRCKRRLAASCGSSRLAAAMQRRLSWHTVQTAAAAAHSTGAELLLAASGLGPRALRRWGVQLQRSTGVPLRLALQRGGNLGCRQVLLGGHVRVAVLQHKLVEQAVGGLAGHEGHAVVAALHHLLVRREKQAALGLSWLVTADAFIAQHTKGRAWGPA